MRATSGSYGQLSTTHEQTRLAFRWLLEEWRVSLFVQPLGTKEPVSLKRLEKRWAELVS